MKLLRIFPSHAIDWVLIENGAILQSGSGEAFPVCDECELIAPAARVLLTRAKLPRVNPRRLAEIAAFAAEENVISEPEKTHVVPGGILPDGSTLLAVIDREWMGKILMKLGQAGLKPRRMLLETLLPKLQPESWALVLNGHDGFLKYDEHCGNALDFNEAEPPLGLRFALQQHNPPDRIVVHAEAFPDLAHWSETLGIAFVRGQAWDWKRADCENQLNLLQGEYSRKRESMSWQALRPAFVMLALMLALQFSGIIHDWVHLSGEKKALLAQMDHVFRESFPDAKVVVDAPLQMERKLEEIRRSSGAQLPGDFMPLLASVSKELSALPPNSLISLDYAQDGIDFELGFAADAALQDFRKRLEASGLKVELKKIDSRGSGVVANIHVGAT
ncbi:MAG: hypothetical protein K2P57_06310 [Burkholderiales bacterium]|nr:hypothetical protein [Burkholderiales bacterium]